MLKGELRKCYFVYPSLCTFRYSFDELRSVLADPFGHSALPQSENYYRSLDFPLDIQPFEMLPSRHGGGIIAAQAAAEPDERWLPECVLHSIADPRTPQGMESFRRSVTCSSLPARVYVLEPQNDPFAKYPTRDGRRFRSCYTTPENVDGCEDEVYWVVDAKPTKSVNRLLEAFREVAIGFQVQLHWLPDAPPILKTETADWFLDASLTQKWCRVSNVSEGVGLNFAVLAFCALHVRNLAIGSCVRAVHLVASIEGRPTIRRAFWSQWRLRHLSTR